MAAKKEFTSEALQYGYTRYIGNNPEQVAAYEEELANAKVAQKIYNLRTDGGGFPVEAGHRARPPRQRSRIVCTSACL
jgi:hypothetical protein